ncbi:ABC transporter ATP-binding protein [Candidatus Marinimicrobia bacterium]|nr:ABC transporter ATP-binding protein [Candidatus Neomarinimicrobiota bacterium]
MKLNHSSANSFSELIRYIYPWRGKAIFASTCSVLNKIFDIAPEVLIGVAVDLVVEKENSFVASLGFSSIESQVIFLGVITFVIWALESTFQYIYSIQWRGLAQDVEHEIRVSAYDHAQRLGLSWHENQSTGNITAVLNDDVNQLERFLNNGINQIIQVLVSTVCIGIIFFYISPIIASIAVLPVPIIFAVSFLFQKKLSPRYRSVRDKVGALNSSVFNNLLGIQTIKSFMSFKNEKNRISHLSKDYQKENINAISISSAFVPVIRMGVLAGFLGTILIGSHMALSGTLAVGSYSVLVFLTQRFLWPFTTLGTLVDDFERSMASSKRIFDLLKTNEHISENTNPKIVDNLKQDIRYTDISFRYPNGADLFHNFSMEIKYGSSVGIVGDTGSGKTTLAKLLLRLYDPLSGKIFIGDNNISNISIENLRSKIGIVSQDTFLFNASIKENISYGNQSCSDEEIILAAKQSQCDEFISSMKDGYDTLIGERGQQLSGGQRQRLAIARAIVRNPDILIFDEATSSVDNRTERLIQKSFFDLKKNRTMIIIAHRLSTIRNCDNIFVIKDSKIHESGKHDELMKNNLSFYAELWNIQTGKKI